MPPSSPTPHRQRGSEPPPAAPGSVRALRLLLPLALTALVVGVYYNALTNPFIIDDPIAVQNHPDVVQDEGLTRLWTRDYWAGTTEDHNLYRPITVLSFHLNRRLVPQAAIEKPELAPPYYRAVNIALLVLVGWLAALWIGRFTHTVPAWLMAMAMVLQPSNTEAINHVVGRSDLQAMAGILGFLYAQRRSLEKDAWSWRRVLGAALSAVVALGSKETGVALLPLGLMQMWLFQANPGRPRAHPPEPPCEPAGRRTLAVSAALLLLPCLVYAVLRLQAVGLTVRYGPSRDDLTDNPLRSVTLDARLPAALGVAGRYFRQLCLPSTAFNQIPNLLPDWTSPPTILGGVVFILGMTMLVHQVRRRGWLAMPLTLALVQYLLVGNLIAPSGIYAALRLTLPFTFAAACIGADFVDRHTLGSPRRRAAALVPCALIIAAWLVVVERGNRDWSDERTRFNADVDLQPLNPVALYHLGTAWANAGERAKGAEYLQQSLQRQDSIQARRQLASILADAGEYDRAAVEFNRLLQRDPSEWRAHRTLGVIAMVKGQYAAAEGHLREALKAAPSDPNTLYNLAELALAREQYTDALAGLEAVLRQDPENERARQRLESLRQFLLAQPK